jgi:small subunit ribosomal protein S1
MSIDKKKKNIALSIKRAEVDPWTTVEQRYTVGQIVMGVVTKIAPFGAFARIEDGIEGLIHNSEVPEGADPKVILHEGAQLQVRILRIEAEQRRLGLSLRLIEEPEAMDTAEVAQNDEREQDSADRTDESIALPLLAEETGQKAKKHSRGKKGRKQKDSLDIGTLQDDAGNTAEGEMTAMEAAFLKAERQYTSEEDDVF